MAGLKKQFALTVFLISIVLLYFIPKVTVDDTAILLRYAENVRSHIQLTYNLNEYTEGYTGMLLLFAYIIHPAVITSQILSVLLFLLGGYFIFRNEKNSVLLLFYMLNPLLIFHSFFGLETVIFTSLTVLTYYAYKNKQNNWLFIFAILLSLCRPEGIILALLFIFNNKQIRRRYLLFLVVLFMWKFYYYGSILPTSFYRKSWGNEKIVENRDSLFLFAGFFMLIPFVLMTMSKKIKTLDWKVGLFILILVAYYLRANLEMNYFFRFYVHIYPLFLIFCLSGIGLFRGEKLVTPLLILQLLLFAFQFDSGIEFIADTKYKMDNVVFPTGNYLKENYSSDKKLAVYFDAGFIPYISKMKTLDLSGLLNKDLALHQYVNKNKYQDWRQNVQNIFDYRTSYLFQYEPDLIVISSNSPSCKDAFIRHLFADYRWKQYRFVKQFGDLAGDNRNYFEFIYERKENEK